MKKRKLSEDKSHKIELVEMDETTRLLLPALEAAVQEVKRIHGKNWPECFGLVIAKNKRSQRLGAVMIDSIDDVAEGAELHPLNIKEGFLQI